MIGTILGNRYEILEVIGSGGMAIVYKAKCRLLNRYVAIKMLRDELKNDKEFVERFRVEAQSAASLNHHNIVSVYDVGQENGMDYFVMEYIDGVTLKEIIQSKRLDWRTACEYAVGICNAIEHAHKKNIVHRDIKPHNIMITHDNVVKVTDFGIARAVSSSTIVRAGNVIGSVHYFSPEQACGGVVDFKSDIYSIGVVLYEMLTGRLPFDADNPVAIAKMHVDNAVTPPSQLSPQIPESVSDIVLKAMAKQPIMRYQTVSAFGQDLKKVMVSPDSVRIRDDDSTQFIPVVTPEINKPDVIKPEKPEKKEKSKGTVFAWIVAAVVLIASIFVIVFAFNPNLLKGGEQMQVPKLIGVKYSEALKQYENASFKINLKDSEYSDEYDTDIIIKQNPETGTMPDNGEINVTVSKGRSSITLANYEGKDVNEVKADLNKNGIENISFEYEPHKTYPKDTVFRQSPGRGSVIKKADKVTIYVSTGQAETEKVKVPNLTGLSKSSAVRTLEAVGLTAGEIKEVPDNADQGVVVSQAITADTQVNAGTSISFSVSKGRSMATPDTQNQPTATPSVQAPRPASTPRTNMNTAAPY